jgi:hypothetical protein
MNAVEQSRSDTPFSTEDPLFRFSFGPGSTAVATNGR